MDLCYIVMNYGQGGPYVWMGRTIFWDRANPDSRQGGLELQTKLRTYPEFFFFLVESVLMEYFIFFDSFHVVDFLQF
jgi:hypothetical protein